MVTLPQRSVALILLHLAVAQFCGEGTLGFGGYSCWRWQLGNLPGSVVLQKPLSLRRCRSVLRGVENVGCQ